MCILQSIEMRSAVSPGLKRPTDFWQECHERESENENNITEPVHLNVYSDLTTLMWTEALPWKTKKIIYQTPAVRMA